MTGDNDQLREKPVLLAANCLITSIINTNILERLPHKCFGYYLFAQLNRLIQHINWNIETLVHT